MPVDADLLVIGSGIAGLRAALSLVEAGDVVIVSKADPRESNTGFAQGGIAAAMVGRPRTAILPSAMVIDAELPAPAPTPVPSADIVRDVTWRAVGLRRVAPALEGAAAQLKAWVSGVAWASRSRGHDRELHRIGSIATVGWLMARAALRCAESRGSHFRTDFPAHDDLHWNTHASDRLAGA